VKPASFSLIERKVRGRFRRTSKSERNGKRVQREKGYSSAEEEDRCQLD
jgi:hypothetical protein